MSKELAIRPAGDMVVGPEFDVGRVVAQTAAIQQCMQLVMKKDEHYGVIPGTNNKPSLLQPGADKLCMLFRLRADYEIANGVERDDWIAITIRCRLYSIQTGDEWGSGMGSANSRETKYVSQSQAKLCPKCAKAAIIRGKPEYAPRGVAGYKEGGWLCYRKKDGCGATFPDDAKEIADQGGVVLKDKVWDLHNTLMKMACKRAKVAAILTATAASDIFTQDLEDLQEAAATYTPPRQEAANAQAPKASAVATPAAHSPTAMASTTATTAATSEADPVAMAKAAFPGAVEREPGSDDDYEPDADDSERKGFVESYRWIGEKINPNIKSKTNIKGEWVPMGLQPQRTDKQNRHLQALRGELKIQDSEWREKLMLYFSQESSANLNVDEADRLIEMLERRKKVESAKRERQDARVERAGADIAQSLDEMKESA